MNSASLTSAGCAGLSEMTPYVTEEDSSYVEAWNRALKAAGTLVMAHQALTPRPCSSRLPMPSRLWGERRLSWEFPTA
jgi:hypothetical protein